VRVEGDVLPGYGAALTKDGGPAGVLTSPTRSPMFGMIGLAVLESTFAENGTRLDVAAGDGTAASTVDVLPIYDPEKKRPRA
jgi:glycine cleavage system aminomethyltransferase T